ncbi:MAG: ABC transporter ATP-binding protein [Alphaproteobacteria bacterium]
MSDIKLTDLTKRYGDLVAVNKANLEVAAGEVLCLLGPSGCGKTTTLRMIAGLESVTDGDVYIAGKRVNALSPAERDIAMVFQFYALYPSLTVAENLAYPLHAEKLSGAEVRARVERVARVLQLEAVMDRIPGRIAEGEKQRVAVGRAIVRDPTCFLFDEPLSRLDIQLRQTMRGQIKEVLSGLEKATVIVTHDQIEALTMADRIAVMRDGIIEQVDSPHGIFARPNNLFVAGFIGTPQMNLLPAEILHYQAGRARFRLMDQEFEAPVDPAVERLADSRAVTLGIRPRAFEPTGESSNETLGAEIDLVEPMGAETLVHAVRGTTDVRVVFDHLVPVSPGDAIRVRIRPGQLHVFDANGARVFSQ